MQTIRPVFALPILLAYHLAAAQGQDPGQGPGQGYYAQPNPIPGGFHNRMGRSSVGVSVGLGGLHDNGSGVTNCDNCRNGLAVEFEAHIGGMLNPQFALVLETQLNARTVHSNIDDADTVLMQLTLLGGGQFWITPQLWVKGGLGVAHLVADDKYIVYDYGYGLAALAAVGFELLSARELAIDLQGRLIDGVYNGGSDHITAATLGVGLNWF